MSPVQQAEHSTNRATVVGYYSRHNITIDARDAVLSMQCSSASSATHTQHTHNNSTLNRDRSEVTDISKMMISDRIQSVSAVSDHNLYNE